MDEALDKGRLGASTQLGCEGSADARIGGADRDGVCHIPDLDKRTGVGTLASTRLRSHLRPNRAGQPGKWLETTQ